MKIHLKPLTEVIDITIGMVYIPIVLVEPKLGLFCAFLLLVNFQNFDQ